MIMNVSLTVVLFPLCSGTHTIYVGIDEILVVLVFLFYQSFGKEESFYDYLEEDIENPVYDHPSKTYFERQPATEITTNTTIEDDGICECVDEEYDGEVETGTLKSMNYPNAHCTNKKCRYTILPVPGKAVLLEIETFDISRDSGLLIWHIYDHEETRYSVFHSSRLGGFNNQFANYNQYVSSVNGGFRIVFDAKDNALKQKGFKMTFERVDPESNEVCGNPHVLVDENEVVVQENKTFNYKSGCVYNLISKMSNPDDEHQEMVIDIIEGDDDYVLVRSYHENGQFSSDMGSDMSRTKSVDAKKVQVISRSRVARKRPHKLALITARLNEKGCECKDENMMILTEHMQKAVIRSPGFGVLYCPKQKCKFSVDSDAHTVAGSKGVFLIETDLKLMPDDVLYIDAGFKKIFSYQFREDEYQNFPSVMMIDETELEIVYEASDYDWMRSFEVNITRIFIPYECQCSKFDEKEYSKAGEIAITIPATCTYIYCHWKISNPSDAATSHIKVELSMENPLYGDYVDFQASQRHERYDGLMLKRPRLYGSTVSPLHIAFSRQNVTTGQEAVFKMNWKFEDPCFCEKQTIVLDADVIVTFETPGYPSVYCDNLSCEYEVSAREYHFLEVFVENIQTENFHDFVRIFNGNSTKSPLIKSLSGIHRKETYKTDNNHLTVTFTSDSSVQDIGMKIKVKAVKMPTSMIPASSSVSTYFWVFLVVLCVTVGGLLIVARRKKVEQSRTLENQETQLSTDNTENENNIFYEPSDVPSFA